MAEYDVDELEGQPHSIIRHPDMPKAAFKDLWTTIKRGDTWRGFVKNKTKNGNFYWVYAMAFPYSNSKGEKGYISVRKMATVDETKKYEKIYRQMNNSLEIA
jgi:aerotaxis receptor